MVLNYLPILMLYPLTANQMIGRLYKAIWRRMFTRIRIVAVIIICLTLSCIASVIFIHTAEVRRHFVKKIGFMDIGIDGHQILINRIFYMFPFGSMVCFMIICVGTEFFVIIKPSTYINYNSPLVIIFSVLNYIPEICLPLLLLLTTKKIRTKVSRMFPKRYSTHANVHAVAPM
ncbi:hypothetical protein L3Y34_010145 [Caenorhabditis briggsae]|uniref:Serpentine receptor class gamma n=1 Tax=Caenorhabditis briggsae TaxID=6238 RepID=A0AAE9D3A4_CAEBR|nr:hypothetical protein L3Y34_010145 [Caenorhabditis briggsae]